MAFRIAQCSLRCKVSEMWIGIHYHFGRTGWYWDITNPKVKVFCSLLTVVIGIPFFYLQILFAFERRVINEQLVSNEL